MHIVQIASECAPLAKVGGLGDVVFGLSKELSNQGHQIDILLPKYDCLHNPPLYDLKIDYRDLWSYEGSHRCNNTVWSARVEELNVFLIDPHLSSLYFKRGAIYGFPDDIDRFTYFCLAALEYLVKKNIQPDIIHIHDWHTAIIALLHKEMYRSSSLEKSKTVLTIHNLEHQGKCKPFHLSRLGLKEESFPEKLQDPSDPTLINLLKGGIIYADALTTVSPNYEKEIKTAPNGRGLDTVLKKYEYKLKGILNGIDNSFWNPAHDAHLICKYNTEAPYPPQKMEEILAAKQKNREQLVLRLELEDKKAPIVGAVTRLVPQKGPDLLKAALLKTLEKGGQFILLGSGATGEIKKDFLELKQKFCNNKNVAIYLENDELLAHLIFAGSDFFIIPSLFEPCGLTQMIALRYGTIPIARMTGGLVDTVFDIETSTIPVEKRNGFTFDHPDTPGVHWALNRALTCWFQDKEKLQALRKQGMSYDFSWPKSAQQYLDLYRSLKLPG